MLIPADNLSHYTFRNSYTLCQLSPWYNTITDAILMYAQNPTLKSKEQKK